MKDFNNVRILGKDSGEFVIRTRDGWSFWSYYLGWTYYPEFATRFTKDEKEMANLPIGDCEWVEAPCEWVDYKNPELQ